MTDTAALPDVTTSEIERDNAEIEHLVTPFKVSRIGGHPNTPRSRENVFHSHIIRQERSGGCYG